MGKCGNKTCPGYENLTICTDNTQTLYNALARIEELEKELRHYKSVQCTSPWEDSPPCRGIQKERDINDQRAQCIKEMREALEYGYSWFAEYATYHAINNKKEKSERNRARADKLRAVLEKWRKK
jgi:hypothetical protein